MTTSKNWDRHVCDAEEIARLPGFIDLRDRIVSGLEPGADDIVVDIGAGTGLLALELARKVGRVWAVDISPAMLGYLAAKAESAELGNVRCVVASAVSLPLVDESVDLAVSNYCFHHLSDDGKERAISEIARVLRPGGRVVFGDMMFRLGLRESRDRRLIATKARSLASRGVPGMVRLARNGLRVATRRWERPASAQWWEAALTAAGFVDVGVEVLEHEGGIAWGYKRAANALTVDAPEGADILQSAAHG